MCGGGGGDGNEVCGGGVLEGVLDWGEVGGGEGCLLLGTVEGLLLEEEDSFFCFSASSRISVSVRRSMIVRMWWVVVRFEIAVGEAVAGRAER